MSIAPSGRAGARLARWARGVVSVVPVLGLVIAVAILETPDTSSAAACRTEVSKGVGRVESLVLGPDGRLWATDERGDRLVAFDVEDERTERVRLPAGTRPHRIIGGADGTLWFTARSGAIGSFDPRTDRLRLRRIQARPSAPVDLVFDREGDGIFFSDPARHVLGHLDLRSGRIAELASGLPSGNRIHGLAVDLRGNVWAALPGSDRIARFNVRTRRFDRFGRFSRGSAPRYVLYHLRGEVTPSLVYAPLAGTGKLGEYEDGTGKVIERGTRVAAQSATADGAGLGHLLVGADATTLWIATGGDELVRFNLREGKFVERACPVGDGAQARQLAIGPDKRIWLSDRGRGALVRVD